MIGRPFEFDGPYVSIRLTSEQRDILKRDADKYGLTIRDVIRQRLWWSSDEAMQGMPFWKSWDEHLIEFAQQKYGRRSSRVYLSQRRQNARRQARIKSGFVEKINRVRVYEMSGGTCGICKCHVAFDDMAVDHIIPVSRGGIHSYANVQAAHRLCNSQKGSRVLQ